jgi:hypothetical protein
MGGKAEDIPEELQPPGGVRPYIEPQPPPPIIKTLRDLSKAINEAIPEEQAVLDNKVLIAFWDNEYGDYYSCTELEVVFEPSNNTLHIKLG